MLKLFIAGMVTVLMVSCVGSPTSEESPSSIEREHDQALVGTWMRIEGQGPIVDQQKVTILANGTFSGELFNRCTDGIWYNSFDEMFILTDVGDYRLEYRVDPESNMLTICHRWEGCEAWVKE